VSGARASHRELSKLRRRMGYVFQDAAPRDSLTIFEYLRLALDAAILGRRPGEFRAECGSFAAGQVAAAGAAARGAGYYVLLVVGLVATIAVTVLVTRIARRALERNAHIDGNEA
jgi:hypothetical protein